MHPILIVILQVLITLIAITGIAVFVYGWFHNGRDAPVVLIGVLVVIIQHTLKIPMNIPADWKSPLPKKATPEEEAQEGETK